MSEPEYDYIVVGGGLTGCALASRLKEYSPSSSVLVIEAGRDASSDPRTKDPFSGFGLMGSDLDWGYKTTAQKNVSRRDMLNVAGKVLGGGSVLNYGGWCRGDSADYEQWALAAGDERWSYDGFLPYFKRTERLHEDGADREQHGFDGPMHVTSISRSDPRRRYGLRDAIKDAYTELGLPLNEDPTRTAYGICEHRENWHKGQRQPSNLAYGLAGVELKLESMVQRVLFSHPDPEEARDGEESMPVATGVQLADGSVYKARREVVVSTGAWRSSQLLMLSGIGPSDELGRHSIAGVCENAHVGRGLFEHMALFQFYRVRDPSRPFSMGNPHWTDPSYFVGLPVDWVANGDVPASVLAPAVERDNAGTADGEVRRQNASLLAPRRPLFEIMTLYAPILPGLPVDGSLCAVSIMLLVPSSRGRVALASGDVRDPPAVDPNYLDTHVDRAVLVHGTRQALRALLATEPGRRHFEGEVPPPGGGLPALTPHSSDEEIEERIRAVGQNHMHLMGGCAMGKVVDAELRVLGVRGLRVADASVFPVAIGGHPQATLYALAEQAADMILGRAR